MATDSKKEAKTYKVSVAVAKREGFGGWHSGGKFWPEGITEGAELTAEQVNGLVRRPGVLVLMGGKPVQEVVIETDEEKQTRTEHVEYTGEKRADGLDRIATSTGPTPGSMADAPLQDSDILHGKPPPENPSAATKPLESKKK